MDDISEMSASELLSALRSGRVSAEDATLAYIERIEAYDGKDGLNAVSAICADAPERARRLDRGGADRSLPLFGLPILVKDNIDVEGMRTTAGSLALADNIATRDAPVIANLRRNGAVILGKTNMTELANYTGENMPGGYSSYGGQVLNAYDRAKNPSGSSSGSAVAVSASLCAAAIGTDTSFSVIGCATDNGVVGLKPPHGALCSDGIVPIALTLDSAGVLAHTVADALMIYSGMRDKPKKHIESTPVSELRIAVNTHNRELVSDRQAAMYDAMLNALREDGARIELITQPHTTYQKDIMRCEFRRDLEAYLERSGASARSLDDIIARYEAEPERMQKYGISYLRGALNADGRAYSAALRERKRLIERTADELRSFDACLMTGPTNIMHFTGLPSMALKLGMGADSTPRGAIIYGADERRLYAAALTLERYTKPVPPPKLKRAACI